MFKWISRSGIIRYSNKLPDSVTDYEYVEKIPEPTDYYIEDSDTFLNIIKTQIDKIWLYFLEKGANNYGT